MLRNLEGDPGLPLRWVAEEQSSGWPSFRQLFFSCGSTPQSELLRGSCVLVHGAPQSWEAGDRFPRTMPLSIFIGKQEGIVLLATLAPAAPQDHPVNTPWLPEVN